MAFPDLSTYGGFQAAIGYAGEIANMNPVSTENMVNESTGLIDFGIAVAIGTATVQNNIQLRTCKLIAVDADVPIGITIRHLAYSGALRTPIGTTGVVGYPQNETVPVMKTGDIFVIPFENVTAGMQASSITAQAGRLGGTPTTGKIAIAGATWQTTTLAGAVGILRISS